MDDLSEPDIHFVCWDRERERESRWAGLAEKSHTKCKYSTLLLLWFAAVLTVLALSPARREKTISSDDACWFVVFFFLSRVKKTKPICAQAVLQTSVVQSKTKMIYLFIPVSLEVCSFAFWTSSSCDLVDGRRWEWWTWTLMPLCFEGRCQNILMVAWRERKWTVMKEKPTL